MADIAQLESALVKADAAGDVDGARVLAAEIRKMRTVQPTPQKPSMDKPMQPDSAESMAAHPLARFALGASAPFRGAFEYLPDNYGGKYWADTNKRIEEMQKAGEAGQSGIEKHFAKGAEVAGNILSPAALKLMKLMPYAVGAEGVIGRAAQLAKNVPAGAAGAGTLAALTPTGKTEGFADAKKKQVAEAMALGAAMPIGFEALRTSGNIMANVTGPFRESWRTNAGRQFINDQLGVAKAKVAQAIANRAPIAIGSPVSTADAIAAANIGKTDKFGSSLVKMEDVLDTLSGGPSDIAKSIAAKQMASRGAEIGGIGAPAGQQRTSGMLDSAIKARGAQADIDYGKAFAQPTQADPSLARLVSNPYFKKAQSEVSDLVQAEKLGKNDLAKYLHFIKESLDKRLETVGESALKRTERRAVVQLKDDLVNWLGTKNKDYETARTSFKDASGPIGRMQIGEELQQSLTSGLGAEKPAALAATARRMEEELGTKLLPQERAAVGRTIGELTRNLERKELASKVDVRDIFDIAEKGKGSIKIPQLWNRPTSIARFVMHMTGNDADMLVARDIHNLMKLDPDGFAAKYLKDVPPSQIPIVMQAIEKATISGQAQKGLLAE